MMMDIFISITAKIVEYTIENVQHKIHSARENAEDIKPAVEEWLKKVDDFVREFDEILANEGRHGRLCSMFIKVVDLILFFRLLALKYLLFIEKLAG
ncbi:putative disease resistance protein [Cucumis melo var. makuwa]|uniref:Disease resistance protein n=1 Tax=Cucumis melo var. makuwa TaxID=1194695 RepID=A0A5D3BPR6_CUCMM|nr:putative disease resistance protein [Cucumis melo var. makuwa]TYK01317.1 putative disease resistance protein [Cucumis melo var. makuwa]